MKPAALIHIDAAGKQTSLRAGLPSEVLSEFKKKREALLLGESLFAIGARGILKRAKGSAEPVKKAKAKD